ncbi:MAG: hypothetical protein DLM60_11830 [Pseudonocardiales bacterium]|nr:MAG: hypothetical protein DLM60_11830 [Pseudonocardiales bacterium]
MNADTAALADALRDELRAALEIHLEAIVAAALARIEDKPDDPPTGYDDRTDEQRREDAIQWLRLTFTGRSFEALARASYTERATADYLDAENATHGHLLNPAARARGIDPNSLFTGPQTRAHKWASPELMQWWTEHGRLTFEEHCAELLGYGQTAHTLRTLRALR